MKCLVLGDAGFVGQHLRTLLESEGHEVVGFDMKRGQNILDYEVVRDTLDAVRPTHIYHLAAQAYVPESFINPVRTFQVNTLGSLNVLEAVRQLGIKSKVLLAGTSEEYGDAQYGDGIITEETVPHPLSPYAISKLAMDHLGQLYSKSYGLDIVVTRAFNHAGPGRGEMYAESAFAKQIVEVELGRREVVEHGNLDSIRNYTDVRDIVRAYSKAINLPSGMYNICSEQNISMKRLLDMLINKAKAPIETRVNQSLYRPADFSFKTPTCQMFRELTGWEPEIELWKTLEDILSYWREVLA